MKPSLISKYADTINSYKYYMLHDFAKLVDQFSTELKSSNNNIHIGFTTQKVQLAEAYIQIMIDYLTSTNETDNNFFTIDEFYDIERHLNKLLNNLYWLKLE